MPARAHRAFDFDTAKRRVDARLASDDFPNSTAPA